MRKSNGLRAVALIALIWLGLMLVGSPALARADQASEERVAYSDHDMTRDKVDLEDHSTYSSEYIFGMSKGVMRSTLEPAVKPLVLVFTLPLDLALLPFAAIAGFFR
jgi:hypothetical protein